MNARGRWSLSVLVVSCCLVTGTARAQETACTPGSGPIFTTDIANETLAANDGWASTPPGTTGGSGATAANTFHASNRQQLVAALANITGNPPRIIYVHGTIDGNVDDANNPLVCTDYYRNGYTLEGYLANPAGMEAARAASATIQRGRMRLDVRSNTTIVGVGTNARLKGVNLRIPGVTNVIIRNLTFEDAYDCFPAWDPTDGALGNWNSAYDNITITNGSGLFSSRIWVDHNAFTDGDHPDSTQPLYFNRPFQWHDGECDINNGSDLVTVSWNRFTDHDKTMLIGGSDSAGATDRNHLKVTIHHNYFANAGQRTPRDRFGQLHVYNNYYEVLNAPSSGFIPSYQYSWGVGIESAIWAQNNAFRMRGVTPDQIIRRFVGTKIGVSGTVINAPDNAVDVLAAYNAANPTNALLSDPGWTPTLFNSMDPAGSVPALVTCVAGDVVRNGWIQCDDLASAAGAVGTHTGEPGFSAAGDVNGDGVVDVRDLAFVSQNLPEATTCAQ